MAYYPDKTGIGGLNTTADEFLSSSLDIFSTPTVEKNLVKGISVEHNLQQSIENPPYVFSVPADFQHYIFLPQTRLMGKIKIVKEDGTKVTQAKQRVAPCNLFPSALFRQVECYMNGVQVCNLSSPTYAYKALLETEMSYDSTSSFQGLSLKGYVQDTIGEYDVSDLKQTSTVTKINSGHVARALIFDTDKSVTFSTPLHIDILQTERLLPPHVNMVIKLLPNSNEFVLLNGETEKYKIKIESLKLYTEKIQIGSNILKRHQTMFSKQNAVYPYTENEIKTFMVSKGSSTININSIFRGRLPKSIIIGLLETEAYNGSYTKNPFQFGHFDLKYMCLKQNGELIPSTPYSPNFDEDHVAREYQAFLDNIGIHHDNLGSLVTYEGWKSDQTYFAFDLTPDKCNSTHFHPTEEGNIDLDMKFNADTPSNITVIVYGSLHNTMFVNKTGEITLEY